MAKGKIKGMAGKWRYWRKPTKVGYNRKGYNFNKSVKTYKKTGFFKTVKSGSGHDAGYRWAESKGIDPGSKEKRYSKNSPSFDEGVYAYKQSKLGTAKMEGMVRKTKTLSFSDKAKTPPKKQEAKV